MISRTTILGVITASLAMFAACIPSLNPYYQSRDVVFDPALLGSWGINDNNETWTFSRGEGKSYRLLQTDAAGKKSIFVVHLFKVGEAMFLDFHPDNTQDLSTDFYKAHHLRTHTFFAVERLDDRFQIRGMEYKWLDGFLKENPQAIAHDRINNAIVLRASTPQLQQFIVEHLKTSGAYSDPVNVQRREVPTRGE